MVSLIVGKIFGTRSDTINWFWTLGVGQNDVTVDNVSGPLENNGGTFDIDTTVETETVVLAGLGFTQRLSDGVALNYQLRVNRHKGEWKFTDSVSGRTGTIDSYTTRGIAFGIIFRL